MKIVFAPTLAPNVASIGERLLPAGFDLEYLAPPSEPERRKAQLESADFLLGFLSGNRLPPSEYEQSRGVKLIQLLSAGYDGIDLDALRRIEVPLATNGGANAVAVAEHTIALMLAVYRQLTDLDRLVRSGGWKASALGQEVAHEIEGKAVGIVGAGNIGRAVARRLQGWDVRLLYADPFRLSPEDEQALKLTYSSLGELLRSSDIVTLHAPADPSTHQMVNERTLAMMKPEAILINCARGDLVDEKALHAALSQGKIAGAGLDTFVHEPPEPGNPLLTLPNVVLTPHAAGPTWESWPKRFANGYANIERVARGEKPLWVVPELREQASTGTRR